MSATGITDLFRRPPCRPPGARPGAPLVARPALLILALGAGADRGVLPSIIAMAIGVAALAALTAAAPADHPRARALRWVARLLAAGLIAGGVTLGSPGSSMFSRAEIAERLGGFVYGTIVVLSVIVAGAKAYPDDTTRIAVLVVVTTSSSGLLTPTRTRSPTA